MNRIDAESAVLGACLIDPQGYWKVADVLAGDDFADPQNRTLWEVIADFKRGGEDCDAITVGEARPDLAELAVKVASSTGGSGMARAYAEWVAQAAVARRVQQAGLRIAKLHGTDALPEAQRILSTCQPKAMSAVRKLRDFLKEAHATLHQRFEATEVLTGVPTSIDRLDELTCGWQAGDLIVIAARPSVGKTAFALQSCLTAAKSGRPVFFASLEQSGAQIAERAISHISRVSLNAVRAPKTIAEEEWPRITTATKELSGLPFMIDETGALTVEAISARARQVNADMRLGLIAIDYLTQIQPPKAEKTVDAIQNITRALKALAKELSVPILLLSQLNRDGEDKPTLRSLRDSGAIEQDADVVIFLHRPNQDRRNYIQLMLAKQRNGPIDDIALEADMAHMTFVPSADEMPPPTATRVRSFSRVA